MKKCYLIVLSLLLHAVLIGQTTFTYTGAIQSYTVPAGTTFVTIAATGAQGGASTWFAGGHGAIMSGTFSVVPGHVLAVLVGQKGLTGGGNAGGGGGGSFVWDVTAGNTLLVAAGGGGGAGYTTSAGNGLDAVTGLNGVSGPGGYNGGGVGGNGGTTPTVLAGYSSWASGGCGWLSSGNLGSTSFLGCQSTGGIYPLSSSTPGAGGAASSTSVGAGGFGGGGGAGARCGYIGGGGGGGYSGGGCGCDNTVLYQPGGGGGSFNAGASQTNSIATTTGNGNVVITPLTLPPCSGTPDVATVIASPTGGGSSTLFSLSLTGYTFAGGFTYSWQSSSSSSGPWTTITGATNSSYTFTGITANTYYRCLVTCSTSSLTTPSTPVLISYVILPTCVPTSASWTAESGTINYGADGFSVAGLTCTSLSDAGLVAAANSISPSTGYLNHTTLATLNLQQGGVYPASVTWGTASSYQIVQVWVDFNDDGIFQSSEEVSPVSGRSTTATSQPTIFNITIPGSAATGVHLMRMRSVWEYISTDLGFAPAHMDPCNIGYTGITLQYYSGDIVDYSVNITSSACSGTPLAGTTVASSTTGCGSFATLLSLNCATAGTGLTYQWQSSPDGVTGWADVSGATASTYAFTCTASRYYRCKLTCTSSGLSSTSTAVSLIYNIAPSLISLSSGGTPGGPFAICTSTTGLSFTDSVSTGTWSNTPTTVGTINPTTGAWTSTGTTGVTTIKYTIGTCSSTATVSVNNTTASAISLTTGLNPMCVYGTITLSDATSGGTWSSSNPSIATVTAGAVNGLSAGTAVISYSTGCGSVATYTVTVNGGTFTLAPTSGTVACTGSNVSLTGTVTSGTATSYSWSGPGGTSTTSALSLTSVAPSAVGTYTFTTTIGSCVEKGNLFLGVTAAPTVTATASPASICTFGTSTLTATATPATTATGYMVNQIPYTLVPFTSTGSVAGDDVNSGAVALPFGFNYYGTSYASVYICTNGWISFTNSGTYRTATSIPSATASANIGAGIAFGLHDLETAGFGTGTGSITWGTSGTAPNRKFVVYFNGLGDYAGSGGVSGQIILSEGSNLIDEMITSVTYGSYNNTFGIQSLVGTVGLAVPGWNNVTTSTTTPKGWRFSTPSYSYTWSPATALAATTGSSTTASGLSATTVFSVTGADAYGCTPGGVGTTTVTLTASPSVITGGGVAVCSGTTVTLTDSILAGTWSGGTTGIATINPATGVVSAMGTGSTTFTYTIGTCSATTTLTVGAVTPGPITGALTACAGATSSLSNSSSGGTWSSTASGIASVNPTSGLVTALSAGTATVSYTTSCGTVTALFTVADTATPAITGAVPLCPGSTITLSDATSGGSWTSSNPSVTAIGSSSGVVTAGITGTAVVTYNTGCGAATVTLTVRPTPGSISGTTSICVGSGTSLTDAVLGGIWTSSTPTVATVDGSGNVAGLMVGTTAISYTTSCGAPATTMVTVNAGPSSIGGPSMLCAGLGSITLTDSVTGGTWSVASTGIAVDAASGVVTASAAGSYTLTYSTSCGTATKALAVNSGAPSAISGSTSLCDSTAIFLTNTVTGGVWTSSDTDILKVGSSTGIVTGVGIGNAAITYATGCGTNAVSAITVNPPPAAITGSNYVCPASTITLSDAVAGGTWTSSASGTASVDASGIVTGGAAGTAVIAYTTGCGSVYDTVTVSSGPASIGGSLNTCIGATTTLTNAAIGGAWTTGDPSIVTVDAGGIATGVGAGTTAVTYTLSGCGLFATAVITVNNSTAAITGTASTCVGATTTLADITAGGSWTTTDATIATVGSTGVVSGAASGVVTISYTAACGTSTSTVTVNDALGAIAGSTTWCPGVSTTLSESMAGGTWASSNLTVASIDLGTGVVNPVGPGTVTITYTTATCGSVSGTYTVSAPPTAISGGSSVCVGSSLSLTDGVAGGTWTSGDATIASIDISTGVATGVTDGTATITYGNECGSVIKSVGVIGTVGAITGTPSLCVGRTDTLNDATPGVVWNIGTSGVATVDMNGVVTGLGSGTVVVTATASCGTPATMVVTVNPLPSPISGPSAVCQFGTVILSDVGAGTWASSNPAIAVVGSTGATIGISGGVANITFTLATGCSITKSITVNPFPNAGMIVGPDSACAGSTTIYTDTSGGGAGTWTVSNLLVATIASGTATCLTAGVDTVYYALTNGCGTGSVKKAIYVRPAPFAGAITGGNTLCVGSSLTLNDSVAGGTWSVSNTAIAHVSSTGVVSGVSIGDDTVRYSYTNSCGTAATSKTVHVLGLPGIISGGSIVCVGAIDSLTNPTIGGLWSTSDSTLATVGSSGGVVGISGGIVSITYATGCGTPATKVITVQPLPSPGIITGSSSLCEAASDTLHATVSGGSWTCSNVHAAVIGGIVTGTSAGIDTVVYGVSNVCGSAFATKVITVNALPVAGTLFGIDSLCIGSGITLLASAPGGIWTHTTSKTTVSDSGIVHGILQGYDTVIYTVNSTYCGTASVSKPIRVLPPTNAGSILGSYLVCVGATTALIESQVGGTWSVANVGLATIGLTGIVTGIAPGFDTVFYTVAGYCGDAVAFRVVTVNALPSAGTITGSDTICVGTSASFTDVAPGGTWSISNTVLASISGSNVVGNATGKDTIAYVVTNSCGTAAAKHAFFIAPLPDAGTLTGPSTLCLGTDATVTATIGGGIWTALQGNVGVVGGLVSGLHAGLDTLVYVVANNCGTDSRLHPIKVDTVVTPALSGGSIVCISKDGLDTVYAMPSGGTWITSNTLDTFHIIADGVATVAAGEPGWDTLTYNYANACGTSTVSIRVNVLNKEQCDSANYVHPVLGNDGVFKIFPNPTTGIVTVVFSSASTMADIYVTDVYGKQVLCLKDVKGTSSELNTEMWPSGTYFIKTMVGAAWYTAKLTVFHQ